MKTFSLNLKSLQPKSCCDPPVRMWAIGHLSILKPPLHGLGTEPDQMPELAVGQALLAEHGDVTDAASRIASNIINGPESGFDE